MIAPTNGKAAFSRWFLSSLQTAQETEGGLRNALLELRRLRDSGRLDGDASQELGSVISALEQAIGHLTVLQRLSREALAAVQSDPDVAPTGEAAPAD
jgi:hypothetical protein